MKKSSNEDPVLYILFFVSIIGMFVFYNAQLENEIRWPWDTKTIMLQHNLKTGCAVLAVLSILRLAWKHN